MRTCLRCGSFGILFLFLMLVLLRAGDAVLVAANRPAPPTQSPVSADTTTRVSAAVTFALNSTPLPQTAFGVVRADFDGDGKPDLATIDSSGVSIWLGNGDGTFRAGPVYPLPQCVFIAAADFTRYGHVDLAVTRSSGSVAVLLGNGDGTFQPAVDYAVGAGPQGIAIADFNGDGAPDIAVANAGLVNGTYTGDTVSILLGNGDGTFRAQQTFATAKGPLSIAAADLEGAGHLGLAVATASPFGTISVLRGNGDGTLQSQEEYRSSSHASAQAHTILAADLNDDGAVDLVTANQIPAETGVSTEISVLFGSSDGTWRQAQTYDAGSVPGSAGLANGLSTIVLADLDGDGKLDLISVGNQISVQLGNGDGSFGTPVFYPVSGAIAAVASDFDNDGFLDLALVGRSMTVLRNSPTVELSGASGVFPPRQVRTVSPPVTTVLGNPDHLALKLSRFIITGDFSQSNNCGSELAAGTQCSVAITFSPQATGVRTGELSVLDAAGRSMAKLALSGQGTTGGPAVTLSTSSLTFTQVRVATHQSQTVQLTNTGGAALSIMSISITGTGEFSQTNNCGASVAISDSCMITVTFSPTFPETQTGAVSIADNASGSPQTVNLTGTGQSVVFSKTSVAFFNVPDRTTSAPQSVTLFNVGPGEVLLNSITISGTNENDFAIVPPTGLQCGPTPSELRADSNCAIEITFTPSQASPESAILTETDSRDPQAASIPITGTVKPIGPQAMLSTTSLSFGTVYDGQKSTMTVGVRNTGDQTLTIASTPIAGEFFSSNNTCGISIAPGATCPVNVIFAPTSDMIDSATLTINTNTPGSGGSQTVSLSGTGVGIQFSKTSLAFGDVPVGQTSKPQTVKLFSLSGNPLVTGMLSGPNTSDFQVTSSCSVFGEPAEIRVGDPCTITVTFTPSATGPRMAVLTYTSQGGTTPQSIPLSGTGE